MTRYVLQRVLLAIPLLVGVSILVFILTRLAPGDPTVFFVPPDEPDPAVRERVRQSLGLDQPLPVQYLAWAGRLLQGDLGYSYTYSTAAWSVISERIPLTFQLQAAAMTLALGVAIPAGIACAVRQRTKLDYGVTISALFGYSMPDFWFGLMLVLIFSIGLGWLPASGTGADLPPLERAKYFVMPTIVLSLFYLALFTRFVRNSFLDVVRQDYVNTARAKGLSERTVLYGHALKNALIPVITVVGVYVPRLFSGAIIVETVFAWPGIGRLIYEAALRRDYPVIMGLALVTSAVVLLLNIVVDVLYRMADPRISFKASNG